MSNNSNFSELIDAYLTGNLSDQDKLFLEEQLKKDPMLENEFRLQQEVVQGIKQYRTAELKARLNTLEVGTGGISTGLKIAASIAISSLVILGTYFYFDTNQDQKDQAVIKTELQEQILNEEQEKHNIDEIITIEPEQQKLDEQVGELAAIEKTTAIESAKQQLNAKPLATTKNIKKEMKSSETIPQVVAPEILDEFDENNPSNVDSNITVPRDNMGKTKQETTINIEIENKTNNNFPFHYQYFNNKLYLYGDFKGIPYEILELNNSRGKNLYLYYDNSYYVIRQNQTEVTPLEPVKNQKLIKELNIIKESK